MTDLNKPVFLCDVDEVLADFSGTVLKFAQREFGYLPEIKTWDLFSPFKPEEQVVLKDFVSQEGFCASLPVLDGSRTALNKIRDMGVHIVIVTSPWNSRTWVHEREAWLKTYFNIPRKDVISTGLKPLVFGDLLLDDSPDHVFSWTSGAEQHPALLWNSPFNRHFDWAYRVYDWLDVLKMLEPIVELHEDKKTIGRRRTFT